MDKELMASFGPSLCQNILFVWDVLSNEMLFCLIILLQEFIKYAFPYKPMIFHVT